MIDMKKRKAWKRFAGKMVAMALCASVVSTTGAAALAADTAEGDIDTRSAMIVEYDANSTSIENLLNSQTLHPQKTGYAALDQLLESVLAPYAGKSTAEKVKACYAWTVKNINYSWAGYTRANSGYNGFRQTYPYDDYEEGLQKAFPEDVIARTYYTMSKHKGVCYDWGAVLAVMVRYIGIDAYVHTGDFKFEQELGFSSSAHGHHGWTEIVLDGKNYIFDPQREYRMTNDGKGTVNYTRYFGVTKGSKNYFRYTQETKVNAARDAGFLSVSAYRQQRVAVNAVASRSGSVSGTGKYDIGADATLTAVPQESKSFQGWYDGAGNLLSSEPSYTFRVNGATTVYAMFAGDAFYDIPADAWYEAYAMQAAQDGWMNGIAPYQFAGNASMTRAMAVQIIANMEQADLSGYTGTRFADVLTTAWYAPAVAWAAEQGVVNGVSDTAFAPERTITREEAVLMLVRYLEAKGCELEQADWFSLPYADKTAISDWASGAVCQAIQANLISGYEDGTLRPTQTITRAEGAAIFVRADAVLAAVEAPEQ